MFSLKVDCCRLSAALSPSTPSATLRQLCLLESQWAGLCFAWWVVAVLVTACAVYSHTATNSGTYSDDDIGTYSGHFLFPFASLVWLFTLQALLWWRKLAGHRSSVGARSAPTTPTTSTISLLPPMLSEQVYHDLNPTQIGVFTAKQVNLYFPTSTPLSSLSSRFVVLLLCVLYILKVRFYKLKNVHTTPNSQLFLWVVLAVRPGIDINDDNAMMICAKLFAYTSVLHVFKTLVLASRIFHSISDPLAAQVRGRSVENIM